MVGLVDFITAITIVVTTHVQSEAVRQVRSRGEADTWDSTSIAPSQVTDLTIVDHHCESGSLHVTLKWTAPGDDGHSGTASRYDIRVAQSQDEIRANFTTAPKIEPGMIVRGSLVPHTAGHREELTTKLPQKAVWKKYVFALKTYDADNNISPMSITQSFVKDCHQMSTLVPAGTTPNPTCITPNPTGTTPNPTGTTPLHRHEQTPNQSAGGSANVGTIVGGIFGAFAILIVTCVVLRGIKIRLDRKVKLHPDPLNAEMTEPSIPYKTFVFNPQ